MSALSEIADRWRSEVVLKRDVFSIVERGTFSTPDGEVPAVVRRLDGIPWWSRLVARRLFERERRGLMAVSSLRIAPPLLFSGRNVLVRGWIEGVPLQIRKPHGDVALFREAKALLRQLHRAGVVHNDLAKEQNWLRGDDGHPYVTDFQLAMRFPRRGRLFRILAYDDLRHLLKLKRKYAAGALTSAEKRVLARKSVVTRLWMASGKKVYLFVTRNLLHFSDREGAGLKHIGDLTSISTQLRAHPGVRDVVVIMFPKLLKGGGHYAFVEAPGLSADLIREHATRQGRISLPVQYLQVVNALPRTEAGEIRTEILRLIAMNQIELIPPLVANEEERRAVNQIINGRQNLRDRWKF